MHQNRLGETNLLTLGYDKILQINKGPDFVLPINASFLSIIFCLFN